MLNQLYKSEVVITASCAAIRWQKSREMQVLKEATKHFKELSNRGFGPDVK